MKQTGLITMKKETDYLSGSLELKEVMPSKDWRKYTPKREKQYDFQFDTMSCTTFATINSIEIWMNYYISKNLLPETHLKFLEEEGYLVDGECNFSDRFTAIMSGTTRYGNYAQAVFDSIRKQGLLPEKDLPFSGNNWEDYHSKSVVTEEMKRKALKILDYFEWFYELASSHSGESFSDALKYTPLSAGIPSVATHFVVLPSRNYLFDTYPPFLYRRKKEVNYSYKFITKIKDMPIPSVVILTREKSTDKQTTGTLEAFNSGAKFSCVTLELPWIDNSKNVSCIPKGEYTVDWTFSPKFRKYTYEIRSVPNRTGIRIHSANYYTSLNGCIALGNNLLDMNKDGELDTASSKITISAFETFMQKKSFKLHIV